MLRSLALSVPLALALPVLGSAQTPQWGVAATYPIPAAFGEVFDVADLNADGRLDIAVSLTSNPTSAAILFGQVDGSFVLQVFSLPAGLYGRSLALGLLDGDSTIDAVTEYAVMHGNGNGTFTTATAQPLGLFPTSAVALRDFNGDGNLDIVSASPFTEHIRVAFSNGSGGFFLPHSYPACLGAGHLTVADIDADGDSDIVGSCSDDLVILANTGSGLFTSQVYARSGMSTPLVNDYTSDGIPDIFVAKRLMTGYGGGLFSPAPPLTELNLGWYAGFDCDGDGVGDVAAGMNCSPCGGKVVVARGLGNGTFDTTCRVTLPLGPSPNCIRSANVMGDARPELLVLTSHTSYGTTIDVLRNLAPDCNANGIDDSVEIAAGGTTDCNANGIPDFCEGDCDANGTFDPCQIAANPAEDLDADGTLDICETAGVPYCFGDGTGNACPCDPGQAGSIGSGCRNSGGNGAHLEARGNPSVSLDSVTLRASGILPTAIGLLFQGNQQQAGGLGGTFGDGLLCVNASVVRLGLRNASGGALSFGYGVPGDPTIAAQGQVPATGATRYYQHWYRDPVPFCTASTFNLTNAVRIVWMP